MNIQEELIEKIDKVYYLPQPQNSTELKTAIDVADVKKLLHDFGIIILRDVKSHVKLKTETYGNPNEENWEKVVDDDSITKVISLYNFE